MAYVLAETVSSRLRWFFSGTGLLRALLAIVVVEAVSRNSLLTRRDPSIYRLLFLLLCRLRWLLGVKMVLLKLDSCRVMIVAWIEDGKVSVSMGSFV